MDWKDETPPALPPGATYKKLVTRIIMIAGKDVQLARQVAELTNGKIFTGHHADNGAHTVELAEGINIVNVSELYVVPNFIRVVDEQDWSTQDQRELIEASEGSPSRYDIMAMDENELAQRLHDPHEVSDKKLATMGVEQMRKELMELENVGDPVE